jgi:hypothetical protein
MYLHNSTSHGFKAEVGVKISLRCVIAFVCNLLYTIQTFSFMKHVLFQINPKDLLNKELVFGGKSDFTLQFGDEKKYETACYVDRNKPVPCLVPSKKKGSFKTSAFTCRSFICLPVC